MDGVVLERTPGLLLVRDTPKGRGVFAGSKIAAGTLVEVSPVLVLDPVENANHIKHTKLFHYSYNWPVRRESLGPQTSQAIVLGLGSMFNHSEAQQNIGWYRDLEKELIRYTALRDIQKGEELCISYGSHLTFKDVDGNRDIEMEKDEAPFQNMTL